MDALAECVTPFVNSLNAWPGDREKARAVVEDELCTPMAAMAAARAPARSLSSITRSDATPMRGR
jgi:hypothetical protein